MRAMRPPSPTARKCRHRGPLERGRPAVHLPVEMDAPHLGERIWGLAGGGRGARRHQVGPLLHVLSPGGIPEADRARFRSDFLRTVAENLAFLEETRGVLRLLGSAGVAAMPLKGALFASRFYPHLGARPQSDVDVLVRQGELGRAHGLLIAGGWVEAVPRGFYEGHYHWVYERPESGLLLELHWRLKYPGTAAPELDRFWSGAREVEAEGMRFLEPAPEDLLAYLAANKGHQRFSSLLQFVDLDRIVSALELDWERASRESVLDGTIGALWFGLVHCREFFGTEVPDVFWRAASRSGKARGSRALRRLLRPWGGPLRVPPRLLEGPSGRVIESMLEPGPLEAVRLWLPLLWPNSARLKELAGGSYPRYLRLGAAGLAGQARLALRGRLP